MGLISCCFKKIVKMRVLAVLVLCVAVVLGAPGNVERIIGGSVTTIASYPSIVALLFSENSQTYTQSCAGTFLRPNAILTAASCTYGYQPINWRVRAGSTYANSGGTVLIVQTIVNHQEYNRQTYANDIAIIHTTYSIFIAGVAQPATFAGPNYSLPDNSPVWAAGWGAISFQGPSSERLRHVRISTVNQDICRSNYASIGYTVTDNMLCSGLLNVGGRDQCQGDSGGPLYHRDVVVGIRSWAYQCGLPQYPGVNTRVSSHFDWMLFYQFGPTGPN